jgi:hypothetical protein
MNKETKNKTEFSKKLLIQESILIWIVTISFIALTFFCVIKGYLGELPWVVGLAGMPWAAYGVSQACYYKKAEKENTKGGIVFEKAMNETATIITDDDEPFIEEDEFDEEAVG